MRFVGENAVRRDGDNLARLYVADEFRAHGAKRTGLAGEGIEAIGIARADQLAGGHDREGIGTLNFIHRAADGLLYVFRLYALACDVVGDRLGIDGRLENSAAVL